ncbi:holo-ACP synthase [Cerasibacillus terrae]|uniref:Holo-[acyl-carrier-protein] synthase n=1 Tax=Cerasibacillus terrae TaxID=2498845 RepID=A0A5C8NIF8_9BACI|nr:holo-ACP synthase [Cerasibacillus terrae]TXL61684.1 holo-ACP synthase [Cerasibacillus terrae]
MIKGIGIDVMELNRIKKHIHHQRFIQRILTKKEQKIFSQLKNDTRKNEFLAGRFSAKEAFSKAAGTGIGKLRFKDIEILPDELGAPKIHVVGFESYRIFLSISHSKEYVVSQVVMEE